MEPSTYAPQPQTASQLRALNIRVAFLTSLHVALGILAGRALSVAQELGIRPGGSTIVGRMMRYRHGHQSNDNEKKEIQSRPT